MHCITPDKTKGMYQPTPGRMRQVPCRVMVVPLAVVGPSPTTARQPFSAK
ncbi:hypothetical protein AB0L13_17090 [Saccharopolyspora shandongensis]